MLMSSGNYGQFAISGLAASKMNLMPIHYRRNRPKYSDQCSYEDFSRGDNENQDNDGKAREVARSNVDSASTKNCCKT